MVCVLVRNSTSTSPEPSAVKRVDDDKGWKRTLEESLKIATASPRQSSVSSPCQTPRLSGSEKPGTLGFMPQTSWPRAFTAAKVCWAAATPAQESAHAKAAA